MYIICSNFPPLSRFFAILLQKQIGKINHQMKFPSDILNLSTKFFSSIDKYFFPNSLQNILFLRFTSRDIEKFFVFFKLGQKKFFGSKLFDNKKKKQTRLSMILTTWTLRYVLCFAILELSLIRSICIRQKVDGSYNKTLLPFGIKL